MGHERTGVLPRSRRWRDVVKLIASIPGSETATAQVVEQTLSNVGARLKAIEDDPGVRAAFGFLVVLASSPRQTNPNEALAAIGIDPKSPATPMAIARILGQWVATHQQSAEYAHLAKSAATDAIAEWYEQQQSPQQRLFDTRQDPLNAWRRASTGAGFCELARLFFSRFTERHLKYFLEREASAASRSIADRDEVNRKLEEHVGKVSNFAFETSKIAQSFSAGWFNKNAVKGVPSDEQIQGFLSVAFGKIREELRREGVSP